MPRVLVIKQETDLQTLSGTLLGAKVSDAQARTAIDAFRTLNPHVADVKSIKPGTVVLVPDSPQFKDSASQPAAGDAIDDFAKLVKTGLADAAGRMRAANTARAEERAEVANVAKLAAFKKAIDADPELKAQVADAAKAAKAAQQEAAQAEKTLDAMQKDAATELAALAKLLG
jgi:hypothetical protein